MMRILLSGCCGVMGRNVAEITRKYPDCCIAAGIDPETISVSEYPIFPSAECCSVTADVLIDFSHPSALDELLIFCQKHSIPAVIATTGFSEQQIRKIHEASKTLPIFFTANMSLGISLMAELARKAAAILTEYDIEIIEKHHNRKIDAPSGTALLLADTITDFLKEDHIYIYDRHNSHQPRNIREIGIHSVRGGTFPGEHEILFAGQDELLSLKHTAFSREIYAVGALNAARFLVHKTNGLYSMKHLIENI